MLQSVRDQSLTYLGPDPVHSIRQNVVRDWARTNIFADHNYDRAA